MPIATPEIYAQMLDRAKHRGFAYPAINVTSTQTLNAALRGFADAGSDGIVQISTGGAEYLSGQAVKNMVTGAVALAEFARVVADEYPVHVALHTDHCPKDKLDGYMRPLVAISQGAGRARPGAAVPVAHVGRLGGAAGREPRRSPPSCWPTARPPASSWRWRSAWSAARRTASSARSTRSCTRTPEDALATAEALGLGERGRYILAATFGNVHGVYKPGHVKLRPSVLKDIQEAVGAEVRQGQAVRPGLPRRLRARRWRRSGRRISYGVVKMNVDTDTQYAFTRPVADHMFKQLRRRAQGGRRGRQQEDLRPAHLGQGGRGGHDRPGRAGLRGPAVGRARELG